LFNQAHVETISSVAEFRPKNAGCQSAFMKKSASGALSDPDFLRDLRGLSPRSPRLKAFPATLPKSGSRTK
jgi:hypothetical protein